MDFQTLPVRDPEYHRIPADKILDVVTLTPTPERQQTLLEGICENIVRPSFDREEAALMDEPRIISIVRKVLGETAEGRQILQRTGSSAADFGYGPLTPDEIR